MNSRDFCIWFKGFLDVTRSAQLEVIQLDIVKKHLEETLIQEGIIKPKAVQPSVVEVYGNAIIKDAYQHMDVPGSDFGYNISNFHQGT